MFVHEISSGRSPSPILPAIELQLFWAGAPVPRRVLDVRLVRVQAVSRGGNHHERHRINCTRRLRGA